MYKYLFGPVPSRRLGISLGIDLIPKKVCTLNCVYCEVGKTTKLTTNRKEYIKYDAVIDELRHFMKSNPPLDYITFSGSGEPTLNSRIGDILYFIKENYPKVKTAVLTNGTLLNQKEIRSELLQADVVLPSLDAASQNIFEKIDRPSPDINIKKYIQGLIDFRNEFKGKIWLEILLLKGYNDTQKELSLLKEAILRINPDKIQLNTLDRPGTISRLNPLLPAELQTIIDNWELPDVEIIAAPPKRTSIESYHDDIEAAILQTIARRPCTLTDLQNLLGIHINEINKYLGTLEAGNKIKQIRLNRGVFYEINKK